jgi:cytochrome c-type biogenesis protein CcmH
MMKQHRLFITLIASAFVLVLAGTALSPLVSAQEPDYDAINRVAQKMNCPTCTGINLADCRTQTCTQWKDQIKDLLAEGYSENEVVDYFVAQYGTQVLQEPPKSGFTVWLWLLPVTMIILGAGILFFTMRKWAGPRPAPAVAETTPTPTPAPPVQNDDYLSQVEKDLSFD